MNIPFLRQSGKAWGILVTTAALLVVLCSQAPVVRAQAADPAFAVLIVGDEGDAEMLRNEKILINEMAKRIRGDAAIERLPIYSYHFNKERERAYCENKLNVLAEDLLFVGIVTLDNKVPLKVAYRVDRIVNPSRAAKDVLERAQEMVTGDARPRVQQVNAPTTTTPPPVTAPVTAPASSPSSSPVKTSSTTVTPPPNSSVEQEGFRVQVGSFTQRKYADDRKADCDKAGFEVVVMESKGSDGDTIFKVLSPVYKAREQADASLAKFKASGFDQAFMTRVTKK